MTPKCSTTTTTTTTSTKATTTTSWSTTTATTATTISTSKDDDYGIENLFLEKPRFKIFKINVSLIFKFVLSFFHLDKIKGQPKKQLNSAVVVDQLAQW